MNELSELDQALEKKSFRLSFKPELEVDYRAYAREGMSTIIKDNIVLFFLVVALLLFLMFIFNKQIVGGEYELLVGMVCAAFLLIYLSAKKPFFTEYVFKILVAVLVICLSSIFIWTSTLPDDIRPRVTNAAVMICIISSFVIFRYNYLFAVVTCFLSGFLFFSYCFYVGFNIDWAYFRFNFLIPFLMGFVIGYLNESEERRLYLHGLKLNKMYQMVDKLSRVDELTQLYNRRHFNEAIAIEWSRAERSGNPIALVLVDIDYFKHYNDFYGHIDGDIALQKVAETLVESTKRPTDIVCRFGGEEFVLILYNTTKQESIVVVERIQKILLEKALPHEKSPLKRLTVSCGIFSDIPVAGSGYEQALIQTDEALYRAKSNGRNQYSF